MLKKLSENFNKDSKHKKGHRNHKKQSEMKNTISKMKYTVEGITVGRMS